MQKFRYNPYKDEFYRVRMILKFRNNPSFKMVFKHDLTGMFDNYMKKIIDPKFQFTQNTILSIYGMTGSGKSAIALTIGLTYFKNFTHENMYFFEQAILDNARDLPENSLVVKDENPMKGVFGQGASRIQTQFNVLSEVSRKYGLNMILVEPNFVQNGITKYYLETVDMDFDQRITRLAMIEPSTLQYMGAVYINVIDESNQEWVKYNTAKDKFIKSTMEGNYSEGKLDYHTIVKKMIEHEDILNCKNKSERQAVLISHYPSLTTSEIKTINDLMTIEVRKQK